MSKQKEGSGSVPVLELNRITRQYHTGSEVLTVLEEADLSISAGEFVGFRAPSGAGKTCLLQIAGLLDRPDEGEIMISGCELSRASDRLRTQVRRDVLGFVFQRHHLLAEFTALDNVAMPLILRGVSRSGARKEAERLLDSVGLGGRLGHMPYMLSGGERQRVAVTRAIVGDPKLILADEPTGNLDPARGLEVFGLLLGLARERGSALLLVTHDEGLAKDADRLVTIADGKIVAL